MAASDLRERILETALDIVEAQGIQALTQPRLAKAVGLRQSHLTYYFPRKADLYIALLEASHARAHSHNKSSGAAPDFEAMLQSLMFDRNRMRFFLGIVIAVSEEPELRAILRQHTHHLLQAIAAHYGREPSDPDVIMFVDCLRGVGLRHLLEPDNPIDTAPSVGELAARFGLEISSPAS